MVPKWRGDMRRGQNQIFQPYRIPLDAPLKGPVHVDFVLQFFHRRHAPRNQICNISFLGFGFDWTDGAVSMVLWKMCYDVLLC